MARTYDFVVVGAGISGLSFAYEAAEAGFEVAVLERSSAIGGCVSSQRLPSGFWYELGAHTCYNSYGRLLELIEACDLVDEMIVRDKAPFRVLKGGALKSVVSQLGFLELVTSVPRILLAKKDGATVRSYYSKIVGSKNYQRVLGPCLAAVPSQSADGFPAASLFKKRPRRKDHPRSFTLKGGLTTLLEALAAQARVDVNCDFEVTAVTLDDDTAVAVGPGDRSVSARKLALAVPPAVASDLLPADMVELADVLKSVSSVEVTSVGVTLNKQRLSLEPVAGIIPLDEDLFFSAVSRDVVADERTRGFAFHFRPDVTETQALRRMAEVLGVSESDFETVERRTVVLPSPVLGHGDTVAKIDALLADSPVALLGAYFDGLALEDCLLRSQAEFRRVRPSAP